MAKSVIRVLFGLTLLLIGTTRNIECQLTVDMELNENTSGDFHQISILLLELKKTMERFDIRLERMENGVNRIEKTMDGFEMRLEKAENGVTQLLQHALQSSSNSTPTDIDVRLEKIEIGVTQLLQQTLPTSTNNAPPEVEMRLEKIEDVVTRLHEETERCPTNHTSTVHFVALERFDIRLERTEKGVNTIEKTMDRFEMRLERTENGVTELLQHALQSSSNSTPTDTDVRLEKIEIGVTQLLQQTLPTSTNNTPSEVEIRLEKIEHSVTQLLQQTLPTSTNNTPSEVEMRLEKIEHSVTQLLQQTLPTSTNNTPSGVEMRLEKIEDVVTRLFEETQRCTTNHTSTDEKKKLSPGTPTLTYSLSGSSHVYATALLNDQLFVSRYNARHVSVYSTTTFQLQRQLTIPGLGSDVYGLATCASNNVLYVSDHDNNCVHKVDLSNTNTNNVIKWNVASGPRGLSVNRARNVLVTCYEAKKVQEYTPSGSLVREISDSNYLWHAVELNSGMLAVSRFSPTHGVAMVTMDGHVIHSYGNKSYGSGVGQMNVPRSIAVDKDGYILVADEHNHRTLIVNPMMTDSRLLPLPVNTSLRNPFALSLDQSRGRLYVGEWSGQNRLLVFDNVTNVGAFFN